MKARITIINFLFWGFCVLALGQQNFMEGYVVLQPNDTIWGKIELLGDKSMSQKCVLKQKDGTSKTYLPDDIEGYRISNNKYFIAKELEGKKIFFEFLVKGKLNVYYVLSNDDTEHYFIEKEDGELRELSYEEHGVYKDGRNYLQQSTRHVGELIYYLQDAPELVREINAMKKPNHTNLKKIAEKYHNIVCNDEVCVVYEQKKKLKFGAELYVGALTSKFFNIRNTTETQIQYGALGTIWLPRSGNDLFFKGGLLLASYENYNDVSIFKDNGVKSTLIRIPLLIENRFNRNGFIQPKITSGATTYYYQNAFIFTIPVELGANVNLNNKMYCSLSGGVEGILAGGDFFSLAAYFVNAGIGINF